MTGETSAARDGLAGVPRAADRPASGAAYFAAPSRGRVRDGIRSALAADEPIIVLAGEEGIGKTALLNAVLAGVDPSAHVIRLGNWLAATLTLDDLLMQLGSSKRETGADTLEALHRVLRTGRGAGSRTILVVEEADTFDDAALSFLGLLPTLPAGMPRPQLILVGSPELLDRLDAERFRPLRELARTAFVLEPLDDGEARAYVQWRAAVRAGHAAELDPAAVETIVRDGAGNPARLGELLDEAAGAWKAGAAEDDADGAAGTRAGQGPALRLVVSQADPEPGGNAAAIEEAIEGAQVHQLYRAPGRKSSLRLLGPTLGLGAGLCAVIAMVMLADKGSPGSLPGSLPGPLPASPSPTLPQPGPPRLIPDADAARPAPGTEGEGRRAEAEPPPSADDGGAPPGRVPQQAARGDAADTPSATPLSAAELGQLRRSFDAFLSRQGGAAAHLRGPERDDLFRQYLAWRDGQRGARTADPGPPVVQDGRR